MNSDEATMKDVVIKNKKIGEKNPTFIIAEMSGNHNGDKKRAFEIVDAAADAGVDAIKLQTYTADTITLDCRNEYFMTQKGSPWEGQTLYELYSQAYTPWEWQKEIIDRATDRGLVCFSTPFDFSAVEFLEELDVPAYKIASYEIQDIPLLIKVAKTKKPIIISTGIASYEEIEEAVNICKQNDNPNIILLKCVSEYPSPYEDINLNVIPKMITDFNCVCGLSDHSMGTEVSVAAVALGARVIEKHLTLRREDGGVDSSFSMEPQEMANMVRQIRNVEKALGKSSYELTALQVKGRVYGRSLFVSEDIEAGEVLTNENIRSVRPAYGMNTKYYEEVIGKKACRPLKKGSPLKWDMIENS